LAARKPGTHYSAGVIRQAGADTTATPEVVEDAVLSPDTALVAYVTHALWNAFGDLWVIDTRPGAKPRRIASGIGPSWSPDGKQLAFQSLASDTLQLFVWDRSSGAVRQVTHLPTGIQPSGYADVWPGRQSVRLSWSPDGQRIVFSSRAQQPADPVSDSTPIILTGASPAPKIWAGIMRYTFAGWQYVKGVPTMVMLSDSLALRAGDEVVQLFVADVATGAVRQLTQGDGGAFDPTWSPDGRTIAFISGEGAPMMASRLRATNVYRIDADGTNRVALTTGNGWKYSPTWSRDSRTVAYFYKPDAAYVSWGRYVVDVDTRAVTTDSARAAAIEQRTFSLTARTDVVVVSNPYMSEETKITFHVPSRPAFTLVDFTQPKRKGGQDAKVSGATPEPTRIEWVGARGKRITGKLRLPQNYRAGTRYPLVVDPYGEWQTPDTLTAAGYVVLAPSPRSPHSPGGIDENTAAYRKFVVDSPSVAIDILVEDVMAGVDTLIARGLVDSTRMALTGFSNGGGAVNYLITRTTRFRCAVVQSPAAGDFTSTFFMDPDGEYLLTFFNGRAPWDAPFMYTALSPVSFVDRVHVPVLYAIGDQEGIPFISSALEMYDGLRRLKRPVTVVRYPGQGHGLTGWALTDLGVRARKFIDQCMK
jgi:dipeptidyl aminopeptidase/acylaminoacyl peptidase